LLRHDLSPSKNELKQPEELVEIKRDQQTAVVLTVKEYYQILELLPQPNRTMVVVAQCTGLGADEVLALELQDIDFENLSMSGMRAVVHGRVKSVKTEYSEDELELDPAFGPHLHTPDLVGPFPACWALPAGVSEVRCRSRCLVLYR
jgi:integrase